MTAKSTTTIIGKASRWLFVVAKLAKLGKLFKALKFAKYGITFLSMALSVFVYAFMLGPWFSVGFVLLLFLHELGHVAALNLRGFKAPAPVFIPMLGAALFVKDLGNRDDEAYIGIGGPVLGSIAAGACALVWLATDSQLWLALAYMGAFLNLFNLIPIRPLDGGRIMQACGSWFKWVGAVAIVLLTVALKNPGMMLIWLLILQDFRMEAGRRFVAGCVCHVGMIALIAAGYSPQPTLVDIMDISLATVILIGYYPWSRLKPLPAPLPDAQPPLAAGVRALWLARYSALVIGLVLLMGALAPHFKDIK